MHHHLAFRHGFPFLALLLLGSLSALDVEPPTVPNPWNTSEERALRDHLAETYQVQAPPTAKLADLRALYRKAWNDEQATRLLNGKNVDQRFSDAKQQEEVESQRDALIAGLERLGVHPDHRQSVAELQQLLDAKKAELDKKQKADMAATREASDRAAERESQAHQGSGPEGNAPGVADPAGGTPAATGLRMPSGSILVPTNPKLTAQDVMSDEEVVSRYQALKFNPKLTAVERNDFLDEAKQFAAERAEMRAKAELVATTGDGVEIWGHWEVLAIDPEKMEFEFWIVNLTNSMAGPADLTITFIGSARNEAKTDVERKANCLFGAPGRSMGHNRGGTFYVDANQQVAVTVTKIWTYPTRPANGKE